MSRGLAIPSRAMRHLLAASCLALLLASSSGIARAQAPEMRGAVAFSMWDAGSLSLAGTSIRTRVYYPDAGGPYPLVGVIHGANANGAYHTELASTLASRGFVAVVPDMPCTVTSCDHDANQRQISALLEWAVAQSADGSSRIAGRVDGTRRGLIGHSWGGLSSHITAARDPSIDSVVLFDPNDDGTDGLGVSAMITAPHLTLLASVPGACNGAWQESMVRTRLGGPHLDFVISRSGHCDPGEMDVFCSFGCGRGDGATTPTFRRYAVAWTACVLAGDASMAGWMGGSDFDGDVSGGRLESAMPAGLESLPCRAGGLPDAGMVESPDAAVAPGEDAALAPGEDAASAELDAFVAPGLDAATSAGVDAGGGAAASSGCGCTTAGARGGRGIAASALLLLAVVLRARSRQRG